MHPENTPNWGVLISEMLHDFGRRMAGDQEKWSRRFEDYVPTAALWQYHLPSGSTSKEVNPLINVLSNLHTRRGNLVPTSIWTDLTEIKVVFLSGCHFEQMLMQRPQRGALTFGWFARDVFWREALFSFNEPERIAHQVAENFCAQYPQESEDKPGYAHDLKAAAIIMHTGTMMTICPFPKNWATHNQGALAGLHEMSARELARLDLKSDLAAYARILGLGTILETLSTLKQPPWTATS